MQTDKAAKEATANVGSIARIPIPTVNGSTPVAEIAKIMTTEDIGAVVVTRDTEPLGIITEKDLVKRVLYAKRDPREVVAQEVMSSPLVTISNNRTVDDALKIMKNNGVRRLIVLKDDDLFGLLTERRLLQAKVNEYPL